MNRLLLGVVALSALASCRGQTSRDAPIVGIRNMYDQPRYDVQEESSFFPDHRDDASARRRRRHQRPGHRPAESLRGRLDDESGYVLEIPKSVVARNGGDEAMVEHGQGSLRHLLHALPRRHWQR